MNTIIKTEHLKLTYDIDMEVFGLFFTKQCRAKSALMRTFILPELSTNSISKIISGVVTPEEAAQFRKELKNFLTVQYNGYKKILDTCYETKL